MKRILPIFILVFVTLSSVQSQSKINFDYSGAEKFYELCTTRHEIKDADIDDLIKSKPYQQLFKYLKSNWGDFYNEELYHHMFRLCFLPDQYTLDPQFEDGKWILTYLQKIKQNPELIKKYIATVTENISEFEILKRAKTYLPNNIKENRVDVYFVVGVNQGCASDAGVFIDHYYDISPEKVDTSLAPWIAHESHHFFRSQLNHIPDSWKQHPELFQAFYWLETEGLAEMAGSVHENLPEYIYSEKNKNNIYRDFNKYIQELDESMYNYLAQNGDGKKILEVLNPPKGRNTYHEVGHLMAFYIEEALGRDVLVKQAGNPLQFIFTYQQAALKLQKPDKIPALSETLIGELKKLD